MKAWALVDIKTGELATDDYYHLSYLIFKDESTAHAFLSTLTKNIQSSIQILEVYIKVKY